MVEADQDATRGDEVQFIWEKLNSEEQAAADDSTIRRFIRATGGDLNLSVSRLRATLAWRKTVQPEEVVCKACAKDPRAHYMHLVGYSRSGCPVIYSCLALAKNRNYEDNKNHMIQTFEMAVRCMSHGTEQWIWVCDFYGFGMGDMNPKLGRTFLDMSAQHYPERLAHFIVLDAPRLFSGLWHVLQPFVDPKTKKKIIFIPYDVDQQTSSCKKVLSEYLDEDTLQWILMECAENRDKQVAARKEYCVKKIFHSASSGHLHLEGAEWEGHDHRGSKSLLRRYASQPSLLLPQAEA